MSDQTSTTQLNGADGAAGRASAVAVTAVRRSPGVSTIGERIRLRERAFRFAKRGGTRLVRSLANTLDDSDQRDTPQDALLQQVRSENEYLRNQLSQTLHQLAAERERTDVLHHQAMGRIEALAATVAERREPEVTPETQGPRPAHADDGLRQPSTSEEMDADGNDATPPPPTPFHHDSDDIVQLELSDPDAGIGLWQRLRRRWREDE